MTAETQTADTAAPVQNTIDPVEDFRTIYVSAGVQVDGESSGSHTILEPDVPPEVVADALLRCATAAAQLHGADTHAALQARLVA
jgi:hypothetical protein